MKRIISISIIITTMVSCSSMLYGQDALKKGVYSIGGSAQYSSTSEDVGSQTITQNIGNISPQFTYFIADHFSIGASIDYNYYFAKGMSYSNSGAHNIKYTTISFGPLVRYYFHTKKAIPFLEASYSHNLLGLESDYPEHINTFGLKGGIEFFLSKSIAFEPSISYTYSHQYYNYDYVNANTNTSTFGFGFGFSYFIFK